MSLSCCAGFLTGSKASYPWLHIPGSDGQFEWAAPCCAHLECQLRPSTLSTEFLCRCLGRSNAWHSHVSIQDNHYSVLVHRVRLSFSDSFCVKLQIGGCASLKCREACNLSSSSSLALLKSISTCSPGAMLLGLQSNPFRLSLRVRRLQGPDAQGH